MKKFIICGYFSLFNEVNTAGDLLVLSVVTRWLDNLGYEYDVLQNQSELYNVNDYTHMIFVCGPLVDFPEFVNFIKKFNNIIRIAINVSVLDNHLKICSYFNYIIPRDCDIITHIDLALLSNQRRTLVCGVIFADKQTEYSSQDHMKVEKIVNRTLDDLGIAKVYIDTKLPYNKYHLNSISEIESVIKKMDFIITTRLHGSILALKNHIPFISIDSVSNGAKVTKQMTKIGWPYLLNVDYLDDENLKCFIEKITTQQAKILTYTLLNQCINELYLFEKKILKVLKEV